MVSERIRLSQNTAILLERARRAGISNDVLLGSAQSGDVAPLKVAEAEHYSYEEFVSYASTHGEQLVQAISEGYQITFNTFNGLQAWLEQAFGITRGIDFTANEGLITGLKLSTEDALLLKERLAANWIMKSEVLSDGVEQVDLMVRGLNPSS